jgi:hypothetical protein
MLDHLSHTPMLDHLSHTLVRVRARSPSALSGRGASVGAPPVVVEAGLPGARDEVRAYGYRISEAWHRFWDMDVVPWAASVGFGDVTVVPPGTKIIGTSMGGDPATAAAFKANAELLDRFVNDRRAFDAYYDDLSSFSISGPSPSEAWQVLQLYENRLTDDRAALAERKGAPLKSADPGPLETPGGVKQGLSMWANFGLSLVKWTVAGIGVYYGGQYLASRGSASPSTSAAGPVHSAR